MNEKRKNYNNNSNNNFKKKNKKKNNFKKIRKQYKNILEEEEEKENEEEIIKKNKEIEKILKEQREKYKNESINNSNNYSPFSSPFLSISTSSSINQLENQKKFNSSSPNSSSLIDNLKRRQLKENNFKDKYISFLTNSIQINKFFDFNLLFPHHNLNNNNNHNNNNNNNNHGKIKDLCFHPNFGIAFITNHELIIPNLTQHYTFEVENGFIFQSIKWSSSITSPIIAATIIPDNLFVNSNHTSFIRLYSIDENSNYNSTSDNFMMNINHVIPQFQTQNLNIFKRKVTPNILEWSNNDSKLLVGCDKGLYDIDYHTNTHSIVLDDSNITSIEVIDSNKSISILGLRNGSLSIYDSRLLTKSSTSKINNNHNHNHKNDNNNFKTNLTSLISYPSFPSCISHIQSLEDNNTIIIKDIIGNISLYDLRYFTTELMKVYQSPSIQSSYINSSRFYVNPNENFLITTNYNHYKSLSSTSSSFSHSNTQLNQISYLNQNLSPKLSIEIWNLKQELNKIHTIPFNDNFNLKNVLFASKSSKSNYNESIINYNNYNYNYNQIDFFGSYFVGNSTHRNRNHSDSCEIYYFKL